MKRMIIAVVILVLLSAQAFSLELSKNTVLHPTSQDGYYILMNDISLDKIEVSSTEVLFYGLNSFDIWEYGTNTIYVQNCYDCSLPATVTIKYLEIKDVYEAGSGEASNVIYPSTISTPSSTVSCGVVCQYNLYGCDIFGESTKAWLCSNINACCIETTPDNTIEANTIIEGNETESFPELVVEKIKVETDQQIVKISSLVADISNEDRAKFSLYKIGGGICALISIGGLLYLKGRESEKE